MFDIVQFLTADFGLVMVERRKVQHQNRLPFSLLLSFGQTKERREYCTNKERKYVNKQESRGCLVAQAKKVKAIYYLSHYAD